MHEAKQTYHILYKQGFQSCANNPKYAGWPPPTSSKAQACEQECEGPVISVPSLHEHCSPWGPQRHQKCASCPCPLLPVAALIHQRGLSAGRSPSSSVTCCYWLRLAQGRCRTAVTRGNLGLQETTAGKEGPPETGIPPWGCFPERFILISQAPGHRRWGEIVLRETVEETDGLGGAGKENVSLPRILCVMNAVYKE